MKKLFYIKLFKVGLNPSAIAVYCNIMSHARSYNLRIEQVAEETGITKKWVRKLIHDLETMNIISITSIPGKPSKYDSVKPELWKIESQENPKNDENITQNRSPLPLSGRGTPLPYSGSTPLPLSGSTPLPLSGSTNIEKDIGKKEYISLLFEKSNNQANFNQDFEKPKKPKLRSRGYTRIATQFMAITASSGWDTEKVKGWANILCEKHGTEKVEENIKRFYENPELLQKSISRKPSLGLFTSIAMGNF